MGSVASSVVEIFLFSISKLIDVCSVPLIPHLIKLKELASLCRDILILVFQATMHWGEQVPCLLCLWGYRHVRLLSLSGRGRLAFSAIFLAIGMCWLAHVFSVLLGRFSTWWLRFARCLRAILWHICLESQGGWQVLEIWQMCYLPGLLRSQVIIIQYVEQVLLTSTGLAA